MFAVDHDLAHDDVAAADGRHDLCALDFGRRSRECVLHRQNHERVVHHFAFDDRIGGDWFDDDPLQFRHALAVIDHGDLDEA